MNPRNISSNVKLIYDTLLKDYHVNEIEKMLISQFDPIIKFITYQEHMGFTENVVNVRQDLMKLFKF